jgi:hypothetical protein
MPSPAVVTQPTLVSLLRPFPASKHLRQPHPQPVLPAVTPEGAASRTSSCSANRMSTIESFA